MPTDVTAENKEIVRRFIDAVNRQEFAALDDLVAARVVRHSGTAGQPRIRSRRALVAFLRGEAKAFPDARETIRCLIAEGNRVAAHLRFRGTQRGAMGPFRASGKTAAADFLCIYRLEGGKIAEVWTEWDALGFLAQLGHIELPGSERRTRRKK
jgi:steroid delta-isomerase-like uncharacterized protein